MKKNSTNGVVRKNPDYLSHMEQLEKDALHLLRTLFLPHWTRRQKEFILQKLEARDVVQCATVLPECKKGARPVECCCLFGWAAYAELPAGANDNLRTSDAFLKMMFTLDRFAQQSNVNRSERCAEPFMRWFDLNKLDDVCQTLIPIFRDHLRTELQEKP